MARIEIKRVDDSFALEATDTNGHSLRMDAAETIGGHNSGVRPMQTLLMGLGGCGGVDIISILKKQRQEISSFTMVIDGEREKAKNPLYGNISRSVFNLQVMWILIKPTKPVPYRSINIVQLQLPYVQRVVRSNGQQK
jgi:putative redox protein